MPKQSDKLEFHQTLVLNRWLWSFFKNGGMEELKKSLADPSLEAGAEVSPTSYCRILEGDGLLFDFNRISRAKLEEYDGRIVRYWKVITAKRNKPCMPVRMKYFQYLILLFTEIYLDNYFNNRDKFIAELNATLRDWNERHPAHVLQSFVEGDLNKVAVWAATASGKTLLLHVNLQQYLHYAERARQLPSRIILLTPNEGLSHQHEEEMKLSGLACNVYTGENDLFAASPKAVQIIDINKLGDEKGDKTVAVSSFEGKNLVMIDEGHRGTSAADGVWMGYRKQLCAEGFSFEYSATFGQAVAGGKTVREMIDAENRKRERAAGKNGTMYLPLPPEAEAAYRDKSLWELYAKCILFDYSYKYFYADGFGKESLILNLKNPPRRKSDVLDDEDTAFSYLSACLLTVYQQIVLFHDHLKVAKEFNIAQPLLVFVGNSVQSSDNADILSDVHKVISFFSKFLSRRCDAELVIHLLLTNAPVLTSGNGRVFAGRFRPLEGRQPKEVYDDLLEKLFHADGGRRLKLQLLTRPGEVALSVGARAFGVINVGDPAKFIGDLQEAKDKDDFDFLGKNELADSLFEAIDRGENPDTPSDVTVLIGSRKFTEGWNSWRVSTMGLMNMGKSEGSQVIQLFGRGVRLKGRGFSLKRSRPAERTGFDALRQLETLNIFGVKANYMETFRSYLEEEGVILPDADVLDVTFPARLRWKKSQRKKIRILRLPDGYARNQPMGFQSKKEVVFGVIPDEWKGMKRPCYTLDLYPAIQQMATAGQVAEQDVGYTPKTPFTIPKSCYPYFDWDFVYRELQAHKAERNYSNMALGIEAVKTFVTREDRATWYVLYLPPDKQTLNTFADVERFQRLIVDLLNGYMDAFYEACQNAYQDQFIGYVELEDNDKLLDFEYRITSTRQGDETLRSNVLNLAALVNSEKFQDLCKFAPFGGISVVCVDRHLFYPLIYKNKNQGDTQLNVTPLGIEAPSEYKFVMDLDAFCRSDEGKAWLTGKELYLLRNPADISRGGIGFTLAGSFYPDFLLWIVTEENKEHLLFVDPKGMMNLFPDNPKLKIVEAVKAKAKALADTSIDMDAYIVSQTLAADLFVRGWTQELMREKHVLAFENPSSPELRETAYLKEMFTQAKLM